jgi:hypothetical protein
LTLITIVPASLAGYTAFSTWWVPNRWEDSTYQERIQALASTQAAMPHGERLLIDDLRYNYYLNNQAVLLFSRPTWDLIQAKDDDHVEQALEGLHAGGVALTEGRIHGWWDQVPLLAYLRNPSTQWKMSQSGGWWLFIHTPYQIISRAFIPNAGFENSNGQGWSHWTALRLNKEISLTYSGSGAGCFGAENGSNGLPFLMSGRGEYGVPAEEYGEGDYVLTPGSDYKASAWVKTNLEADQPGTVFMYIQQFLKNGEMQQDYLSSVTTQVGEYEPLVAYFQASPKASSFRLLFRTGSNNDRICIDEIRMEAIRFQTSEQ